MKIVHVTPYYPPHLGGVEIVAKNLSEALAKRGHKVDIITSNISQSYESENNKFAKYTNISIKTISTVEFAHIPFSPALFGNIYRKLKSADLVHVHAGIAYYPEMSLLAAKILHKPLVVTFHCDTRPSGKFGFLLSSYNKIILKRVLQKADFVVCLSNDHAQIVKNTYGVDKKKIIVIPNGIDDAFFSFKRHKRRITKSPAINLLFVGRLAKQKNIPRLIDAVEIISKKRPVVLRILGSGEEEEKLKALVEKKGLLNNILFLGALDKKEINKWEKIFDQSDIFVLSSDYEGVPVALMEAMAARLPCVATNVRGVREVAKIISKLSAPNPKAIASAIEALFNNPLLMKSLSKKAFSSVSVLRWEKISKLYEDVYLGVLK